MKIPNWLPFFFIALASYRIWRVVAVDDIFERPRLWLVGLPRGWESGDEIPKTYRLGLAKFISCPWCLGLWVTLVIWGFWLWQPTWTTGICAFLAATAVVGLIEHFSSDE